MASTGAIFLPDDEGLEQIRAFIAIIEKVESHLFSEPFSKSLPEEETFRAFETIYLRMKSCGKLPHELLMGNASIVRLIGYWTGIKSSKENPFSEAYLVNIVECLACALAKVPNLSQLPLVDQRYLRVRAKEALYLLAHFSKNVHLRSDKR